MKKITNQLLCAILSLELLLGNAPRISVAAESPNESVASIASLTSSIEAESDSLFGTQGCASIDEKGNINIKHNETTKSGIDGDPNAKSSLNCASRVNTLLTSTRKLIALKDEADKIKPASANNKTCAECNAKMQDAMVLPEALCSNNEKKAFEKEIKSNSSCDWDCEWKSAWNTTKNQTSFTPVGVIFKSLPTYQSTPSCKINSYTSMNSLGPCLSVLIESMLGSLKDMCESVWKAAVGAKDWVKGWFGLNKSTEKAATDGALIKSGLSDQEIQKAKVNAEKSTFEKLSTLGKFFDKLGEWSGFDTPKYREIMACAKCGERINAACKVMGVMGKDFVKNAIIIYLTGGTLKVIAGSPAGKKAIAWGGGKVAAFTAKHAASIEAFSTSKIGKPLMIAAKTGGKVIGTTFEITDKIMTFPTRVMIKSGKKVAVEVAAVAARQKVFTSVPGLANEVKSAVKAIEQVEKSSAVASRMKAAGATGEASGLSTIEDLASSKTPILVEVPRPMTPGVEKAKASIERMKVAGKNQLVDIENATETKIMPVNNTSVKIETDAGEKYLRLGKATENVEHVRTYNHGNNAIVTTKDNFVHFTENGEIVGTIKPSEVQKSNVKALLGEEEAKADDIALRNAKESAQESGLKVEEPNSTPKNPEEFKINSGENCGNQSIIVEKAI